MSIWPFSLFHKKPEPFYRPEPRVTVGPPPPLPQPALKPGWDRMPKSEGAWQPPPPDAAPVTDWVSPPRIIPVIIHKRSGDKTACGLDISVATEDKGTFVKHPDWPDRVLFRCNIVGDEERTAHCATCFAEHVDGKDAPTGYLAKTYLDEKALKAPAHAPTTDEKGRVPPVASGRGTWHEMTGNLDQTGPLSVTEDERALSPEDIEALAANNGILSEGEDSTIAEAPEGEHLGQKPSMSPESFCYWLQGVFEVQNPESLNADQIKIIKEHLALVLTHVSEPHGYVQAPSYCGSQMPGRRAC